MWLRDCSVDSIIHAAWNQKSSPISLALLMTKIKLTKLALKNWNRIHFGNLHKSIQHLKLFIDSLQSTPPTSTSIHMEQAAQRDLDELLLRERILWYEKAKAKWLAEGDANTSFFHLTTILHRRNNHIHYIITHDHTRISNDQSIGDAFVSFFSNLFASVSPDFPTDLQDLITPTISDDVNSSLVAIPTPIEIKQALFSMANNKSPGPDGMTPIFFKNFWSIVGNDLTLAIQDFFIHGRLTKAVNHTFIALIPKRLAANRLEHFRPISLCSVVYKIITKIISTRLKPVLGSIIHPNQTAFIPGRSIVDNCIINQEVMHYLQTKKGNWGFMAVKIDMAKAYDMVEWPVLLRILALHGFCPKFCALIQECVSTANFSVLINGAPHGYFAASRGIRQGDPVSPALFSIFSDLLSRILTRAEVQGKISGVKISRGRLKLPTSCMPMIWWFTVRLLQTRLWRSFPV